MIAHSPVIMRVHLSPLGEIVSACLQEIPAMYPAALVDAWVIMPNHLHLVVLLHEETSTGASAASPVSDTLRPPSLPRSIQTFKATTTRRVNSSLGLYGSGNTLWQRNHDEHIIRNKRELGAIRAYIRNNPANWPHDKENPEYTTMK